MASDPALLLLDEALVALDRKLREHLRSEIKTLQHASASSGPWRCERTLQHGDEAVVVLLFELRGSQVLPRSSDCSASLFRKLPANPGTSANSDHVPFSWGLHS